MLRKVRLLHLEVCEKRAGGELAVPQGLDNGDAGWVGKRLEDLGLEGTSEDLFKTTWTSITFEYTKLQGQASVGGPTVFEDSSR